MGDGSAGTVTVVAVRVGTESWVMRRSQAVLGSREKLCHLPRLDDFDLPDGGGASSPTLIRRFVRMQVPAEDLQAEQDSHHLVTE